MAEVKTIDITTAAGSDTFPLNANKFLAAVETIAAQNIRACPNTNRIENGFYDYSVEFGAVIEEAIVKLAEGAAFAPTADGTQPDLSPKDAKVFIKFFNNWDAQQYKVTKRYDEITKIIARGGTPEEVAAAIVGSLTEGESFADYGKMRAAIETKATAADCSTALFGGKVPANMKGVAYALRQMYNVCKATNDKGGVPAKQGVDPSLVRVAISEKALNLMDVTELANLFNLSKEELFGTLVVLPEDETYTGDKVLVYDVRAMGRGTRLYEMATEDFRGQRYENFYLNTDRCYFDNGLFKTFGLDISQAMATAEGQLLAAKGK